MQGLLVVLRPVLEVIKLRLGYHGIRQFLRKALDARTLYDTAGLRLK